MPFIALQPNKNLIYPIIKAYSVYQHVDLS